jgi:hypothetical protein
MTKRLLGLLFNLSHEGEIQEKGNNGIFVEMSWLIIKN